MTMFNKIILDGLETRRAGKEVGGWKLFQEEIQANYHLFECLRLGRLLHPGICIDFISLVFLRSNLESKVLWIQNVLESYIYLFVCGCRSTQVRAMANADAEPSPWLLSTIHTESVAHMVPDLADSACLVSQSAQPCLLHTGIISGLPHSHLALPITRVQEMWALVLRLWWYTVCLLSHLPIPSYLILLSHVREYEALEPQNLGYGF